MMKETVAPIPMSYALPLQYQRQSLPQSSSSLLLDLEPDLQLPLFRRSMRVMTCEDLDWDFHHARPVRNRAIEFKACAPHKLSPRAALVGLKPLLEVV